MRFTLNIEKSFEMFKKHQSDINKGLCYNNALEVLVKNYLEDFKKNRYKIALCYVGGGEYLYNRHGIILNHTNEIIDLSVPYRYKENTLDVVETDLYRIFKILTFDDFVVFVNRFGEDLDIGFKGFFESDERKVVAQILEEGGHINDYDYEKYVKDLLCC